MGPSERTVLRFAECCLAGPSIYNDGTAQYMSNDADEPIDPTYSSFKCAWCISSTYMRYVQSPPSIPYLTTGSLDMTTASVPVVHLLRPRPDSLVRETLRVEVVLSPAGGARDTGRGACPALAAALAPESGSASGRRGAGGRGGPERGRDRGRGLARSLGGLRGAAAGRRDGTRGRGADDGLGDHAGAAIDDGTAGNGVGSGPDVDVEDDAGVVGGEEGGAGGAAWVGAAAARDLEVDALGVRLSAVWLAARVESEDLVAEDVVAGRYIGRDPDAPLVAVLDEEVGGVGLGCSDETGAVDLEETQVVLVHRLARAVAVGQVVEDRAAVRLGPVGPLESDDGTSSNADVALAGGCLTMADDVRGAVAAWLDEAEICLLCSPAGTCVLVSIWPPEQMDVYLGVLTGWGGWPRIGTSH